MSLITIDQVGTTRRYNYDFPTLTKDRPYRPRTPKTSESFKKEFDTLFPQLQNLDWGNLGLRGGAVINLLLGLPIKDLDIFIYGINSDLEILVRVNKLLKDLLWIEQRYIEYVNDQQSKETTTYKKTPQNINIKAVRRGSVITCKLSAVSVPIQIVLGCNESIESLISNTDIEVCGIVYNGTEVLLTENSKWELENMTIKVDKKYPNVERLDKYFDKGFDIALTELDINKMPRRNLKRIPELLETQKIVFSYSSINNNKILVDKFYMKDEIEDNGYDGNINDLDGRSILYRNIKSLSKLSICELSEDNIKLFSTYAEGDNICDVLRAFPELTIRQLKNAYSGISKNIYNNEILNGKLYKENISIEPLSSIYKKFADISDENDCINKSKKIINDVVKIQIQESNRVSIILTEMFKDRGPHIFKEDEMNQTCKNSSKFYGEYLLTPDVSNDLDTSVTSED